MQQLGRLNYYDTMSLIGLSSRKPEKGTTFCRLQYDYCCLLVRGRILHRFPDIYSNFRAIYRTVSIKYRSSRQPRTMT